MRASSNRLVVLASLTVLVGCDHATKLAAKAELEAQRPRELVRGVLDLQYTQNPDTAFNLMRAIPEPTRVPVLLGIGAAAIVALGVLLLRRRRSLAASVPLLLVTAGALGNTLDRARRGYVVDFVHLHHWPVFNVADVYVTVGAALFAVSALRRGSAAPSP
jgi:signal peptidase II